MVSGCADIPDTKERAIKQVENEAAQTFKDPESAQFKNVTASPLDDTFIVCGEISGRNALGAYSGFSRFIGVPDQKDSLLMEDSEVIPASHFQSLYDDCKAGTFRRQPTRLE